MSHPTHGRVAEERTDGLSFEEASFSVSRGAGQSRAKEAAMNRASFSEIEDALLFVSSAPYGQNSAVINRETGQILYRSEMADIDEFPDEEADPDSYCSIPHKNDLDLGQRLVFSFASERLAGEYDRVRDMFRRRGAYGRFKDLLTEKGLLEEWYEFENEREREALMVWCRENDVRLAGED
jgi:hypothetical protein